MQGGQDRPTEDDRQVHEDDRMKIVASFLLIMMFLIVGWFMYHAPRDKATMIGFSLMEITYILCLIGMWYE